MDNFDQRIRETLDYVLEFNQEFLKSESKFYLYLNVGVFGHSLEKYFDLYVFCSEHSSKFKCIGNAASYKAECNDIDSIKLQVEQVIKTYNEQGE